MSSPLKCDPAQPWIVLKFGGTSVSSAANWHNIAQIVRTRIAEGFRPAIVHSALSGITDRLDSLLASVMQGSHGPILDHIEQAHRSLAERLNVIPNSQFEQFLGELRTLTCALAEHRRMDDEARARVMAMGELLATTIGAEYLIAQGIGAHWIDARRALHADEQLNATYKASLLSATCDFAPVSALQTQWRALEGVVITQGFIASNAAGQTVLLGRGGSDTS